MIGGKSFGTNLRNMRVRTSWRVVHNTSASRWQAKSCKAQESSFHCAADARSFFYFYQVTKSLLIARIMPPDELQIGGPVAQNKQSFVQNGQVDWVAFANSIWSTSSAVLQRFASAGVQPITFGAGLALASVFDLDRIGKQRMHSALETNQGMWGFGKVLYFGFGTRSFLNVMADVQSGVNCIALCSALSEVHDEHAAAWILDELWKTYGFPQQFLPSHSQMTALVKACSGVLTKTGFSPTTDRMLGHTLDPKHPLPFISNPEDIANAMSGLFKISKGIIARITVTGGMECAFVAAFAHWLLNLKVYVDDDAGRVIHQDAHFEEAQVVVTYRRQADLSLVQVSSTTYVLREDLELIARSPTIEHSILTIRTPWDGCLTRVFGTAFNALTKASTNLGNFFGSTARVYQALALGESDIGQFSRKTYINFVESSYGIGFIHSVVSIFPELKRASGLFDEMQVALNVPLQEALRTIERTILNLEQLCSCSRCTSSDTGRSVTCIVVLAFSIREMVSTISCVTRDDNILPTVRGIRLVYGRHESDWPLSLERPLLAISLGLGMNGVYGPAHDEIRNFDLLSHPIEIFSGYSDHTRYLVENNPQGREWCTATVNHGLCYYLNCLQSLSSHAENARMVHIVSGHIQMGDKQFNSVYDYGDNSVPNLSPMQMDILGDSASAMIQQRRHIDIKLEMLGLEKAIDHELIVFYRAMVSDEPAIKLQPGRISHEVLKGTGMLTCERSQCTSRLVLPCAFVRQGWQLVDEKAAKTWIGSSTGPACLIWPQLEDLARCMALQTQLNSTTKIVLRRGECTSCCTVSLLRDWSKQDLVDLHHVL